MKAPLIKEIGKIKSARDLRNLAESKMGSEIKVVPGLIQNGKLLVALESGLGAGLVAFAIDSGVPTWQYFKGHILKPEFTEKILEAAINGASVGGATAVMVCLGANPAGFMVQGIAAGTYILVEKAQQICKENRITSHLSKDDLFAFGIPADSVLDVHIDESIPMNAKSWNK